MVINLSKIIYGIFFAIYQKIKNFLSLNFIIFCEKYDKIPVLVLSSIPKANSYI